MTGSDKDDSGSHHGSASDGKKESEVESASSSIKKRGLKGIKPGFKRSDARDDFEWFHYELYNILSAIWASSESHKFYI